MSRSASTSPSRGSCRASDSGRSSTRWRAARAGRIRRQRQPRRVHRGRGPAAAWRASSPRWTGRAAPGPDRARGDARCRRSGHGAAVHHRAQPAGPERAGSSPPTPPPARTACASCSTRPTAATATRSSTARTAGRGSPSSRDVPYDRPPTTMARLRDVRGLRARSTHDPADRRFHAQPVCCPAAARPARGCSARRDGRPHDRPAADADRDGGRGCCAAGGDPRRQGARRLPPRRRRRRRGGRRRAARAQAPGGQAVRRHGRRPRRRARRWPSSTRAEDAAADRSRRAPDRAAAAAGPTRPVARVGRAGQPPPRRHAALHARCTTCSPRELGAPIVLTSGNVSDEPIAYRDDDARARLAGIADAFLDPRPRRSTSAPTTRWSASFRGRRAAAPALPRLRARAAARCRARPPRPVLACGAELKNTFCLAKGRHAFLSHHIGDLENYETLRSFTEGDRALPAAVRRRRPTVVAHDLHPEYLSTKYALEPGRASSSIGVQHHHAHIASCLADNGEAGPVDRRRLRRPRLRHRRHALGRRVPGGRPGGVRAGRRTWTTVPMPGGAAAIRQPWRMAAAYLRRAPTATRCPTTCRSCAATRPAGTTCWRLARSRAERAAHLQRRPPVRRRRGAARRPRRRRHYEGQAAIELEQRADPGERDGYPAPSPDGGRHFRDRRRRPGAGGGRGPAGRGWTRRASRPASTTGWPPAIAAAVRAVRERTRPRHRRPLGRRLPEPAPARALRRRAGRRGFRVLVHRGAPQRRRHQPRPGGDRERPVLKQRAGPL